MYCICRNKLSSGACPGLSPSYKGYAMMSQTFSEYEGIEFDWDGPHGPARCAETKGERSRPW